MTLRVGFVGCGGMGQIHLSNIGKLSGRACVAGVYDPALPRSIEMQLGHKATIFPTSNSLIESPDVDAVVISSPPDDHAEQILACLEVSKPVYCEKPLTSTLEDSARVREVERGHAHPLVWAGFMRRFDPLFLAVRREIRAGRVGEWLYGRMSHRNPSVPEAFTDRNYMLETFIHEFDAIRWLFDTEIREVRVISETGGPGLTDPQFIEVRTSEGKTVLIDGHITNGYGYDIQAEAVGTKGSIALADVSEEHGLSRLPFEGWRSRFTIAYQEAIESWIDDVTSQRHTGVTSADAEQALATALAGVKSQASKQWERVS